MISHANALTSASLHVPLLRTTSLGRMTPETGQNFGGITHFHVNFLVGRVFLYKMTDDRIYFEWSFPVNHFLDATRQAACDNSHVPGQDAARFNSKPFFIVLPIDVVQGFHCYMDNMTST